MYFEQTTHCNGLCCCSWVKQVEVQSPPGIIVGYVNEVWKRRRKSREYNNNNHAGCGLIIFNTLFLFQNCTISYSTLLTLTNAAGDTILKVRGEPCCPWRWCNYDEEYKVYCMVVILHDYLQCLLYASSHWAGTV